MSADTIGLAFLVLANLLMWMGNYFLSKRIDIQDKHIEEIHHTLEIILRNQIKREKSERNS